jgi:hypothetical protein
MLLVHLQDSSFGVVKDGEPSAAIVIDLLFISANEGSESMFCQVMEFDKSHTHALSSAGSAAPVPSNTTAPHTARSSSGAHPETSVQQQQRQPAQMVEQLLLTCLVSEQLDMVWQLVRHPAAACLGEHKHQHWS